MAFPESSRQFDIIPSFLYSSSLLRTGSNNNTSDLKESIINQNQYSSSSQNVSFNNVGEGAKRRFLVQSPNEGARKIEMYSPAFYAVGGAGGILSCSITHGAVTPIDVVKCNMQVDPAKYKNTRTGFAVLLREQGAKGLYKGWAPTMIGYGAQGACKFGFYEFFKKYYSDIAGPEYAAEEI